MEAIQMYPYPESRMADLAIPNNFRPILLLSGPSKTFVKMLTNWVEWSGKLKGTISPADHASTAGLSAIDTVMQTLTPGQESLLKPSKPIHSSKGPSPPRRSVLANDTDGAFNCVGHKTMLHMVTN